MPQTAEAFLEEAQPSAEDFLGETQSAEDFLAQGGVEKMASATRHTVGVVGRAVKALDFVAPHSPGDGDSYEQQLSDAGLTAEQADAAKKQAEGMWVWERGEQKWYPSKEMATAAFREQMATAQYNAEQFTKGPELPRIDFDKLPQGVKMILSMPGSKGGISTGAKIAAGTYNAAKTLPEFFMTPLGASLLATGNLPEATRRLIAAGFAVDMASHAPEHIHALAKAVENKDPQAIAEATTALGMTATFIGLATKHAMPKTPLERVAPLTAEATVKVESLGGKSNVATGTDTVVVGNPTPLTTAAVESVKAKEPASETPTPSQSSAQTGVSIPAFAQKYPQETLFQRPAWVEPGSAFDVALGKVRDAREAFTGADVTGIWDTLTPEQRQDLVARGWQPTSTRTPGQVVLNPASDALAARNYYGAQNRISARKLEEAQKEPVPETPAPTPAVATSESGSPPRSSGGATSQALCNTRGYSCQAGR